MQEIIDYHVMTESVADLLFVREAVVGLPSKPILLFRAIIIANKSVRLTFNVRDMQPDARGHQHFDNDKVSG